MKEILKPINDEGLKAVGEIYLKNNKPYQDFKGVCPKCFGDGFITRMVLNGNKIPVHPDGGVCYKCMGQKYLLKSMRVYSEKELKAIEKRKERLEEKRKIERVEQEEERRVHNNQIWKKNLGFLEGDEIYLVALKDTFNIKDELKEKGARWMPKFRSWGFQNDECKDLYPLRKVELSETTYLNEYGIYQTNDEAIEKIINSILNPNADKSEYIGKVGDRMDFEVKFERAIYLGSNQFGSLYANKMVDDLGNVLMWKSSTAIDKEEGSMIKVKGTIKEHNEYNSEKQTILTRCKVL